MEILNIIINVLAAIWVCGCIVGASPKVDIKNGTLEGTVMRTRREKTFFAFRGIPYALPPTDELRFQAPQPAASWIGIRSAKEDATICTQKDILFNSQNIEGDEDCLFLNVYSPRLRTKEFQPRLPVMVWFHGGGWVAWSGHSDFYGPKFLLDHDVVLVTANYRLGAIGFLSTEDMIAPGNMGMKDQTQVLRWVQENIASFGGDPNSVTIFGESAGGASVHYHMLSPLSRNLFHRAISQSGTALCPWTLSRPNTTMKLAQRLAHHLECPTTSSTELVNCLRKKSAVEIINAERIFSLVGGDSAIPFRIVIESDHPGAFLKEEPTESLKIGNMADIPWMVGINRHEGCLQASPLYSSKGRTFLKELNERWTEFAPICLLYGEQFPKEFQAEVAKEIRDFYFGDDEIDQSTKWNLIDLYSDAWFNIGVDTSVREHLESLSSPIYYYHFDYKGNASFSSLFGDSKDDFGVCHCDELQYLFPLGDLLFPNTSLSDEEHRMVDTLTNLWYNFAKTGNPTPQATSKVSAKWKPVRTEALEYLSIKGPGKLKMSANLNKHRIQFWKTISQQFGVITPIEEFTTRDEL